MKQWMLVFLVLAAGVAADAQVHGKIVMGRNGNGRYKGGIGSAKIKGPISYDRKKGNKAIAFQPSVNLALGYGFPNLDKQYFSSFPAYYKAPVTQQTGPFMAALDYHFSRIMSVGVMGTYGKLTQPYFDYSSNTTLPDITGHSENWSVMFNLVTYIPTTSRAVAPYIRTAVGYNNWKIDYTDAEGVKTLPAEPPAELAYQAAIGTKLNLTPRAAIYLEGGYGKYIASGGLAFKF